MGPRLDKNLKEKLTDDVENINKITSSDLFYKKMGINFNFSFDQEDGKNFINPKFIMVKTENEENRPKGHFYITSAEFFNFYNTLLECIPIFYEDSIIRLKCEKVTPQEKEKEEELCCICDDRKSDVMLECCVG
jgi:hypothetical protein